MQEQNANQLKELHREYRPAVMAFFLRRTHNYSEAEDLTQEAFIRIAGRLDGAVRSVEPYLFQIAANLLGERARRAKVRSDYLEGLSQIDGAGIELLDPHRVAAGREALTLLMEGLADLPDRTRRIFLLFRYENLDHRTIAESFGISISAVEKHIYRAMAKLIARVGDSE